MLFQSTLIATLLAATAAEISSTSKAGIEILSKARQLNDQNDGGDDLSWMAKYDLKFDGCHTIHTYRAAEGGDGNAEEGDGNQSPFGTQHLAKFKLCSSSSSCSSCANGGTYMVELGTFAEAYLQAEQANQEALCQAVEENCNCEYYNGDDQACMSKCYKNAGYDFCEQQDDGFDASGYLACAEAGFGYYNSNAEYVPYYIGPTCSGASVHLAVFTDAQCVEKAPSGTYENKNGGYKLPYSTQSLISTKCVSCKADDGNDGDNQYYQAPNPSDTCTGLYEGSGKCEPNLTGKYKSYRDTGSCDYINKIVPALSKVYTSSGGGSSSGWAVFFGLTTLGFAGAAYHFYSKVKRTSVNLSSNGDFA